MKPVAAEMKNRTPFLFLAPVKSLSLLRFGNIEDTRSAIKIMTISFTQET